MLQCRRRQPPDIGAPATRKFDEHPLAFLALIDGKGLKGCPSQERYGRVAKQVPLGRQPDQVTDRGVGAQSRIGFKQRQLVLSLQRDRALVVDDFGNGFKGGRPAAGHDVADGLLADFPVGIPGTPAQEFQRLFALAFSQAAHEVQADVAVIVIDGSSENAQGFRVADACQDRHRTADHLGPFVVNAFRYYIDAIATAASQVILDSVPMKAVSAVAHEVRDIAQRLPAEIVEVMADVSHAQVFMGVERFGQHFQAIPAAGGDTGLLETFRPEGFLLCFSQPATQYVR